MLEVSDADCDSYVLSDTSHFGLLAIPENRHGERLDYILVKTLPLYLYVHKDNPLARLKTVNFAELKNENFLMLDKKSYYRKLIYSYSKPYGFKPTPTFESSDVDHICSLVNTGTVSYTHLDVYKRQIYQDAKFMIDYSRKSIASAKAALCAKDKTFCVGTSLLNPAKPFMDLWYRVNKDFPEYKLHLVPFEDNHDGILSEIEQLGKKFDFLIGVCDSRTWLSRCNFLPLGRYKKMVAVSREPVSYTHLF